MLEGRRPTGKGKYFSKSRIEACTDPYLSEHITSNLGEEGFVNIVAPTLGSVEYQMPKTSDYLFLLGDPGTGTFPARNAPCIGVIDASNLPEQPAVMIAFWWGNGNKSIQPFIDKLYDYKEKYRPIFVGVDSTGPQSGMVQILNLQQIWAGVPVSKLYETVPITGMDFSVGRKANMLISLRNMVELQLLKWADMAKGIKMQLSHYDPMLDRGGEPRIAQDIVSMLSMAAFVIRAYYNVATDEEVDGRPQPIPLLEALGRDIRNPVDARDYRR